MNPLIRVVVADPHRMFRAGIVGLLQALDGVEVVAQAGTSKDAIEAAAVMNPDVLILDLDMPDAERVGTDASSTASAAMIASPQTKVVVLTTHESGDVVQDLLRAGVNGYLLKSSGPQELYAAIASAARDENAVLISVSKSTAAALTDRTHELEPALLTRREVEVLQLLTKGGTNRLIARELQLAEATIKRHLATIYAKLEVHSRLQLVAKAQQMGLLS